MRPCHFLIFLCASASVFGAQLPPAKIDEIAAKALAESGAPSVSIAVVESGKIALEKAYGKARLEPAVDARPDMLYSIGSVSKQLLAGCVLLLVQDGKLSLDDRVSKYRSEERRVGKEC